MSETSRPLIAFLVSLAVGVILFQQYLYHTSELQHTIELVGDGVRTGKAMLGTLSSIVVIISSVILYIFPKMHRLCGFTILIFSLIGSFAMGIYWGVFIINGFSIVFGVLGGILAITWKPEEK